MRNSPSTLVIQEGRQRTEEVDDDEESLRRERRTKRRNDRARATSEQRPDMARIQIEKWQVRLDSDLLARMITFDNPESTTECAARIKGGKKVRSGRRLSMDALGQLEATEGFLEFITGIGFDWLLEPSSPQMPLELAQEFFTTFHFTYSTDIGAESISFRLFTREIRMSMREWSARLGLYTADQEVEWFGRDIGPPKAFPEFNEQAAWAEMVPEGTRAFQPTESTADCIKDPILRLAQVFVGVNLLGQANTVASLTEAELYFMWCMMRKRKVHLGYWLARTCHSISTRANRNLNACHILGSIFTNCVVMTMEGKIPKMTYCPRPELFGLQFLTNIGVLVQRGGVHRFYEVTKPGSQPDGATKKKRARKQGEGATIGETSAQQLRIEAATPTQHAHGDTDVPSHSAAPEVSTRHTSLVELVGGQDDWRARMEGLMERIASNTERMAQNSEAQTQLLTSQNEIQTRHNEDVRASVLAVREMVTMMARDLIPQRHRDPQHTPHGESSRRPAGRDDAHPRLPDSRRDQPRR